MIQLKIYKLNKQFPPARNLGFPFWKKRISLLEGEFFLHEYIYLFKSVQDNFCDMFDPFNYLFSSCPFFNLIWLYGHICSNIHGDIPPSWMVLFNFELFESAST